MADPLRAYAIRRGAACGPESRRVLRFVMAGVWREAELSGACRYRLVRQLGAGGMGEVHLAQQEGPSGFSREVVLKRLLPHLAGDPACREMFLDEARLTA